MKAEGVRKVWDRYKYAALVVLVGAALMLWPTGNSSKTGEPPRAVSSVQAGTEVQSQLESILGTISGVGQVRVLLTVDSDGERQLARDTELSYRGETASPEDYSRRSETVLVDDGQGDGTVVTRTLYPTFRGALVVCQGGDRPEVRLAVTEAVTAVTGLTADRVAVAKWQ